MRYLQGKSLPFSEHGGNHDRYTEAAHNKVTESEVENKAVVSCPHFGRFHRYCQHKSVTWEIRTGNDGILIRFSVTVGISYFI